jgi:hypothetical protein
VSVALTIVTTLVIFHGRAMVPLWGIGNVAFDLIPATLLPCIGGTIAISKATVAAVRQGLIKSARGTIYTRLLPRGDALAGVAIGVGLLAVLGLGFIGVINYRYDGQQIPFSAILTGKLIYGLVLSITNTPIIIGRAKERSWRRPDHDQGV